MALCAMRGGAYRFTLLAEARANHLTRLHPSGRSLSLYEAHHMVAANLAGHDV